MIKVGSEREIQFNKQLRYDRQRDYNIFDYSLSEYEFQVGKRSVYDNLNFSIFVDDYCNADCRFCVAQLRYEHISKMYNKVHITDMEKYLARLEEVLKIVRPLNPSVSITGGEPSISPIIVEILKLVDKYNFRKRTITTNGSGLLKTVDNDALINHLVKYGWNHLNISRAHYDDAMNKEIMRYKCGEEYCGMSELRDIINTLKSTDLHHRLSCLLLKDGIGTLDSLKRYVDTLNNIGVNNYIFRELMDYDKNSVNLEKMRYCDANKVRLNEIWEEMEQHKEFEPYMNLLGYYYYVEIYHYLGATIASESANLNQQYAEKEKHPDTVYEMIFHNNGNLCGSWVEDEEVLDEYKN